MVCGAVAGWSAGHTGRLRREGEGTNAADNRGNLVVRASHEVRRIRSRRAQMGEALRNDEAPPEAGRVKNGIMEWLGRQDSNLDNEIQNLGSYR